MSERERWIVYPLLFLALGAALRDKLSEQTTTKRIECQELIVSVEERADREPLPLVRIGAVPRSSAESPHVGEIQIDGLLVAKGIQAETMQTGNINADNYYYQRVPFAPTWLRAVPGVLRALKQSAEGLGPGGDAAGQPDQRAEPTQPPSDSSATAPEPQNAPTSDQSGKTETPPAN
jgi:hypothetical protein